MSGIGTSRVARMIARKDLTIEWRGRVLLNQVVPFAALVMVMFAFALDGDDVLQRAASGLSLAEGFALENQAKASVLASEDAREGPRAFMEKRPPEYRNR